MNVTENPRAEACGHLYHATIRDAVKNTNIIPFHCNCSIEPDDNEWDILKSDKSYQKEGICKALIKLNVEWDSLPSKVDYLRFWNEDRFGKIPGITMSSMLFCKHGGIITLVTSGQENSLFYFKRLEFSKNQTALGQAFLQPATSVTRGTQVKIQGLLEKGILYFDENHYERVLNTGLDSDPYLVALGDYYRLSAPDVGMGDGQGFGAIFKVTLSSGKEIYVTLGDSKNPDHTAESRNAEGKDFYEGSGEAAHTLEFFCDYDNMSTVQGADKNMGRAITIMDGASITDIELLVGYDIDWTEYFEEDGD